MIQVLKCGSVPLNRYDLSDFVSSLIEPSLANEARGVPRVDDRHMLDGSM